MALPEPKLPYPINRMVNLLVPGIFMIIGICFGTYTFLHLLLVERKPTLAFDYAHWRDQSFARMWMWLGPIAAKSDLATVPSIAGLAEGVVVDLGPGSGLNVTHFERKKITKLYLVEPCLGLHEELKVNLKKAGLDDIAVIIPCGAQDTPQLLAHGLKPSTVDAVCTIKVLCSVPNQLQTCRSLYSLLKPGGSWLVFEHVLADAQYPFSRLVQHIYQILWPNLMGGCNLTRDTKKTLMQAGDWDSVDLGKAKGEYGWESAGHIVGRLVKAK